MNNVVTLMAVVCVAVIYFISVNSWFPLFCGMVMYANEFGTKEK